MYSFCRIVWFVDLLFGFSLFVSELASLYNRIMSKNTNCNKKKDMKGLIVARGTYELSLEHFHDNLSSLFSINVGNNVIFSMQPECFSGDWPE